MRPAWAGATRSVVAKPPVISLSKNWWECRPWATPANARYCRPAAPTCRAVARKGEGGSAQREGGRQAHPRVLAHEHQKARLPQSESAGPQAGDVLSLVHHNDPSRQDRP